jgi:hypothetical protein
MKSLGINMSESYTPDPTGMFAFLYRHGRCNACGMHAVSLPRTVVAASRPPIEGRASR